MNIYKYKYIYTGKIFKWSMFNFSFDMFITDFLGSFRNGFPLLNFKTLWKYRFVELKTMYQFIMNIYKYIDKYFVNITSDAYFPSVIVVPYGKSYPVLPCYNGTRMYIRPLSSQQRARKPTMVTAFHGSMVKQFPRYWYFVRGIHRSQRPVTHSFDVSLICASINGPVNNREAGDLRRHRAHYDVIVMIKFIS